MEKLNLIIVDYDKNYLDYLNKFLSNTYKGKFEITCFSDKEIFVDTIKGNKKKSVLLINDDMYDMNTDNMGIVATIRLTESMAIADKEEATLNKYKDVSKIHDMVLKTYLESNSKQVIKVYSNNNDTKIITVYSPIGGSGKSMIAAALSANIAKNKGEVLYLNLEDIQSTDMYFSGENHISLSDVIFEVKDKSENFIQKLLLNLNKDTKTNVSYIDSTENILDIEDINEYDINWFLKKLLDTKKYNYIIIDTVSKYNSVYNIILNSSDIVITPILNDTNSSKKLEKFINSTSELDKYYFVCNMNDNNMKIQTPKCLSHFNLNVGLVIDEHKALRKYQGRDAIRTSVIEDAMNKIRKDLEL